MRKLLVCLFTFFLVYRGTISAQSDLPQFAVFNDAEINMKECPFEKDADAVILLDEASSDFGPDYQLITLRRIRIKILNERGLNRAKIVIPFYSKEDFEYIRNIEAVSIYQSSLYTLDKKSIYTEKVDQNFSNIKFALPNVKVGSIIEYRYESVMKDYGGLTHWLFQSDIPTVKSCYLLHMIPNAQFSYVVTKKPNYPITIKQLENEGKTYFEMNNIPSLHFEPYMDAVKDYLQKVEFQFSGYISEFGGKRNVNTTWEQVAYSLATDKELGGVVKKDVAIPDELKQLLSKENTNTGKMTVIYNYVRKHFTWNGYDGKYAMNGLKKLVDTRAGSAGEINLLLLNFFQQNGIESYPMLVSERDNGRIDPRFPFIDRFNKTIAYVMVDGKNYILDATQKYCPPGLTPFPLLNTYGLIVNKKTTDVISIADDSESFKTITVIKSKLDKNGSLAGYATVFNYDYAKLLQTEAIKEDEKKFIRENYEAEYEGLKVEEFNYENIDSDSAELVEHVTFTDQFDESGGYILLNYNLFTSLRKNPFVRDERFTNVNFGFPMKMEIEETIDLPENSKLDAIPKNRKLTTPDKDISISREIQQNGNSITIRLKFSQEVTLVPFEFYAGLQDFYKTMVDMLNEPITVKVNSK